MEIAIFLGGLAAWILTYGLWKDESRTLEECLKYERSKTASLIADLAVESDSVLALEQALEDRAEVDRQIREALGLNETGSTIAAVKALRAPSEVTTMRFSCGHCQAQIGDHSTTRDEALALWKEHATNCPERPEPAERPMPAGVPNEQQLAELIYEYVRTGRNFAESELELTQAGIAIRDEILASIPWNELTRDMIVEKYDYLTGRETSWKDEDFDDFYAFILGYYPAREASTNG